jgi:subtilisin-like proprotein convertase family protein
VLGHPFALYLLLELRDRFVFVVEAFSFIYKSMSFRLKNCLEIELAPAICEIEELEHVSVFLNLTSNRAGHVRITLTSPCGTSSVIIPGRQIDNREQLSINVTSVQFWGENPSGIWTLQVNDSFPLEG